MATFLKIIPLITTYVVAVLLLRNDSAEAVIGINWGRQSAQRLIPSMVVDLLLQNKVTEVRIYYGRGDIIRSLSGSGIGLTLTVLQAQHIATMEDATSWVQAKVAAYQTADIIIRRVFVGIQPFSTDTSDKAFMNSVINATELIQNALNDNGYGNIKATITHNEFTLKGNFSKPSEAEFRDEIKEQMKKLFPILHANNAPFVIDMFPLSYVNENNMAHEFAFVDNKSNFTVVDTNGLVYRNVFDFLHDSFIWAIKKLGGPDFKVLVGQVGWPTDGYPGANAASAERFYKGLLPIVTSNRGTPMRPGAPIDIFVHALTDENLMNDFYPFARHWGIYRSNGEPKFKIDLTGQGRDIYPTKAEGVRRMPKRWCVFNGHMGDTELARKEIEVACNGSDCTSLAPGGSCSHLDFASNISYAFNMYFQFSFQAETACNFSRLGKVVTENPSVKGCEFPVEVTRAEQDSVGGSVSRLREIPKCAVLLSLLSILLALL